MSALDVPEVDRSIPFVDAHHHLWDLEALEYDWLTEPGRPRQNERLGDYRMIRSTVGLPDRLFREFYGANVIKSIHVEAAYSGPDPVAETQWLDQVARSHGMPHGIVVHCDLRRPDAATELDRHCAASDRVRGVRIRGYPDDPTQRDFRSGYRALKDRALAFELGVSPGRLLSGRDLALKHPDIQVVLVHAGFPVRRDVDYFDLWRSEITALAEIENVAAKISGLAMIDHQWTIESIRPWILHMIDAFGPHRIMFGTNWPVDMLYATYLEQTDAYRRIIADAGFDVEQQSMMLATNAERFYRI